MADDDRTQPGKLETETDETVIFQTFTLDAEMFCDVIELEENKDKNYGQMWLNIRRILKEQGYTVLEGMCFCNGFPTSVILGGRIDGPFHKTSFYTLTNQHDVPFLSGEAYHEVRK